MQPKVPPEMRKNMNFESKRGKLSFHGNQHVKVTALSSTGFNLSVFMLERAVCYW